VEPAPSLLLFHEVLPGTAENIALSQIWQITPIYITCSLARNSAAGSTSEAAGGGVPNSSSKFSIFSEISPNFTEIYQNKTLPNSQLLVSLFN
jgi:hypothetical protein